MALLVVSAVAALVAAFATGARADDGPIQLIPPADGAPEPDVEILAQSTMLQWVIRSNRPEVELWRTGGTPETTYFVAAIPSPGTALGSSPFRLVTAGASTWIVVADEDGQPRLWWTSTTPGTAREVVFDDGKQVLGTWDIALQGDDLAFADLPGGQEGIVRIVRCAADSPDRATTRNLDSAFKLLPVPRSIGGRLAWFEVSGSGNIDGVGSALLTHSGGSGPASLVASGLGGDFGLGATGFVRWLGGTDELGWFATWGGVGAATLWTTDGTPPGTHPIGLVLVNPAPALLGGRDYAWTESGVLAAAPTDRVAFFDGTPDGTRSFALPRILRSCAGSCDFRLPFEFAADGDELYFVSDVDESVGPGVWNWHVGDPVPGLVWADPEAQAQSSAALAGTGGVAFVRLGGQSSEQLWFVSRKQLPRRLPLEAARPFPERRVLVRTVGRWLVAASGPDDDLVWSAVSLESLHISRTTLDTDLDGIPDEIEESLGTSSLDAADSPLGGPAGAPRPADSVTLHLRVQGDSVTGRVSGRLRLDPGRDGRATLGALDRIVVSLGGIAESYSLRDRMHDVGVDGSTFRVARPRSRRAKWARFSLRLRATPQAERLTDELFVPDSEGALVYAGDRPFEPSLTLWSRAGRWSGTVHARSTRDEDGTIRLH